MFTFPTLATANQFSTEYKEVGNPVRLDFRTDPFHRVTQKIRTFMTFIDLIPVDWSMTVDPFFQTGEDRKKQGAATSGVIQYNFENAINRFKDRCTKYQLPPTYSGIRVVSTSQLTFQETIQNEYTENAVAHTLNQFGSMTSAVRDFAKSFDSQAQDPVKFISQLLSPVQGEVADRARAGIKKATDAVNSTIAGGLTKEVLNSVIFQGRQISLPAIWQSSSYNPSIQLDIQLVSPYGSPKAIRKHIVEPLVYLLLLCSPDTTDGVTYGGNVFLKVKAYGHADINLAYVDNITITRGGSDVTFNKHNQPLSVRLSLSLKPAIFGFACVAGKSNLTAQNCDIVDGGEVGPPEFDPKKTPIGADFGFATVDNVIRSFSRFPKNDYITNNGEFISVDKLTQGTGEMQTALGGIAGKINSGVGTILSSPSALNANLNSVIVA